MGTRCAKVKVGFTFGLSGRIKAEYEKTYRDLVKLNPGRPGLEQFDFKIITRGATLFQADLVKEELSAIKHHCYRHKTILYKEWTSKSKLAPPPEPVKSEETSPAPAAPVRPASSPALASPELDP